MLNTKVKKCENCIHFTVCIFCNGGGCNVNNCNDFINQNDIARQKAEIEEYEKVVGKLGRKDGKVICVLKGKETEYIPTDIASVYKKLAISKAEAEAYKKFADLSIKRINEQISVSSPNDNAVIKRCSDIIFETLKEKLKKQK